MIVVGTVTSVADFRQRFDAGPDPTINLDADSDPTIYFDADPVLVGTCKDKFL
jgi:hypothetical protein